MPKYFAPHELGLFADFLEKPDLDEYYVVQEKRDVIACGGLFFDTEKNRAGLAWGMVHADFHGQGIGKKLTQYRIEAFKKSKRTEKIILNTSQHTYRFYEKMGFELQKITPDGFGKGLDNYLMTLKIEL